MQGIIISNQVINYQDSLIMLTPIRLLNKQGVQIPNYPVVTRGNIRDDNQLLQQLWSGDISIADILPPAI